MPSLELNATFYRDAVAPLVTPWRHSAALLGWGSDVLGFDTPRSTDHGWGLRLQVFVEHRDLEAAQAAIDGGLPDSFAGHPVRYGWDGEPARHHVAVTTLASWLRSHLGRDPREGMTAFDWLVVPQQLLLGVVRGAVYADDLGTLEPVRSMLRWYPRDVWLWMMASQWRRIAQEEAFVGRTAEVGDDLGSRLVAARLVRELMRLCFLLACQYWPYTKWFGTAFAQLDDPDGLGEALGQVLAASDHPARGAALATSYELVAARHNARRTTSHVDTRVRGFHDRGFVVLMADRFADACLSAVADERLRVIPLVGSVDQFADSTDVLSRPDRAARLRAVYTGRTG